MLHQISKTYNHEKVHNRTLSFICLISGGSGGPLKTKAGLTAGLTGEARISNVFAIQLEANYSSQGTGIVTVDGEESGSAEYRFANGIFISGRYHFGLNNLIDSEIDQSDLKNRYYSMRIGYSIKL